MTVTLLDGGTGTELRARGVNVPSHITSIWSAQALMDDPDAVVSVHRDYIEAGADVVTVNNYAVTPPLLAREGLDAELEPLTVRAGELAQRARDESKRPVRIAGSVPPLDTSYRADLVGDDATILAHYRRIVAALAARVDLLLCETMASGREAVAAVSAARETGLPVWVSFTLQGRWADHLPSGETLAEAQAAVAPLEPDAYLVNCCGANLVGQAVPVLAALTDRPVGGYGHAADLSNPHTGTGAPEEKAPEYTPLDEEAYAARGLAWIDAGAAIVGGCCSTRPAHIAALRHRLER